jgi:hypothetical protein
VATFIAMPASLDRAKLQLLARFLPKDEPLIWVGSPQLSRLFLRAIARTAVMALIASVGIYFAARGITPEDFCGADPSRGCRKLYFWPWFGLIAAAVYLPFLWLSLVTHASGLLPEFYGLTSRQALKLRSNPFDRFQSVKLGTFEDTKIGERGRFGTLSFGWLAFLCLSDEDREAALRTLGNLRTDAGKDRSSERGATS